MSIQPVSQKATYLLDSSKRFLIKGTICTQKSNNNSTGNGK